MATSDMSVDDYFASSNLGSIERAIGNNLYGIKTTPGYGVVPGAADSYGYTFFTRPQLNLQSDNLRMSRLFYPLLSGNELSIQRYVRTLLDPRLNIGYNRNGINVPAISSPLLDNDLAFMAVLSNNLVSISGFPDIALGTYTSKEGLYKESQSMGDSIAEIYNTYDVDASFRNTIGDPIIYAMYIWVNYISNVFQGKMSPYPDFILENAIDYNTRIYRVVIDKNRNIVKKIFATGASFPITVPTGAFADYNNDQPLSLANKEFSIRFKSDGFIAFDDILIYTFNKTVSSFNPGMRDGTRDSAMYKVPSNMKAFFDNRVYPRIDPYSLELEWWVKREHFDRISSEIIGANIATDPLADSESNEFAEGFGE